MHTKSIRFLYECQNFFYQKGVKGFNKRIVLKKKILHELFLFSFWIHFLFNKNVFHPSKYYKIINTSSCHSASRSWPRGKWRYKKSPAERDFPILILNLSLQVDVWNFSSTASSEQTFSFDSNRKPKEESCCDTNEDCKNDGIEKTLICSLKEEKHLSLWSYVLKGEDKSQNHKTKKDNKVCFFHVYLKVN